MARRAIAVVWLVVGIAIWNGVFDLYVSRGAREYLQLKAESELGLVPPPSMSDVMARAEHMGLVAATLWTAGVLGAAWLTVVLARRPAQTAASPPAA